MKKRDFFISIILFFTGIISRLPLIEKMHVHRDSPTHALALINYSFEQESPVPPGYPLYFALGKLLLFITHDPHLALLYVSVLFSGIGAVVFFLAGRSFGNRTSGIISALLFLSSSTIYFFGVTIYAYLVISVMTTLIAWCVYLIAFRKKSYGILIGVIYAISLGVRPQEVITTFPFFLYGLFFLSVAERKKAILAFIGTFLLWFIPFMIIVGGFGYYMKQSLIAAHAGLPLPTLTYFLTKKFELASGFFLTFGIGIVFLTIFLTRLLIQFIHRPFLNISQRKKIVFCFVWFMPSVLFNFFVRTEHAGYQMGYLTFFLFLLAYVINRIFLKRKLITFAVTLVIVGVNLFLFFYNRDPGYTKPYRQSSFHYSDIRRNDYVLSSKINFIKSNYDPKKTIIVVGPVFWRQAMYYLPEYQIFEIDALVTDNPIHKDTRRDAMYWKRHEYKTSNYSFIVPEPVNTLILFDDESGNWVSKNKKVKQFKGTTRLTIVPVRGGDIVNYGLGSLQVISKT